MSESRPRVAITTNTLGAGGAERQRVLLANALVDEGVEVELVVLQELGPLADELDPRVRLVRRRPLAGMARRHDLLVTGTTRTEVGFGLVSALRRRAGRWAVAVHNPVGAGAPRLPRFALAGCLVAGDLVALTPEHGRRIAALWGLRPSATISNAIDPRPFAAAGPARRDFAVGFLGRLDARHKGIDRLLRAVAEPGCDLTLAVAGVGPDEAAMRRLADELGIADRVSWLGYATPQEFLPRIGALAVLSRFEAQPLVVLEAEAAGVPVVASLEVGGTDPVDAGRPELVAAALVAASGRPRTTAPVAREPRDMAREYLALLSPGRRPGRLADPRVGVLAFWRGRAPAARAARA